MDTETAAVGSLRALGLRITPQRLLVLCTVRQARAHLTAAQVLAAVRQLYPHFDASTVYWTLNTLRTAGMVSATDMGDGELVYEWRAGPAHHHLICRACGAVMDVTDGAFADLAALLRDHHGFAADLVHCAVAGYCAGCAERGETSVAPTVREQTAKEQYA